VKLLTIPNDSIVMALQTSERAQLVADEKGLDLALLRRALATLEEPRE
jgi:hypothetical protein